MVKIITEISKCDVKISNVTCDGFWSNLTVFEMLGANFNNLNPSFKNPFNGDDIYVTLDPCHMEKLVRNTLADREFMYNYENNKIEWKYLVRLERCSQENYFGLSHKINKRHIQHKDRIMHVRTAVETFSTSTADSIEYLKNAGAPEFLESTATIEFIRNFNDLFDIMNTFGIRDPPANQFKSAINPQNQQQVFIRLNDIKQYILTLKVRKSDENRSIVPVLEYNRKTGSMVT